MGFSIEGHIAAIVVINTALNSSAILRWWFNRRRPHVSPAALAADILFYGMVGISLFQTIVMYYRLGQVKHLADNPPPTPEEHALELLDKRFLLPLFIETVGYSFNIYMIKGAFIALYYDILPHLSKKLRWALHVTAGINVAFFLMTFIMTFAWCQPLSSYWEGGVNTCSILTDLTSMNIITWSSIALDVVLMVIPTIILRSLKLRRSERWALAFVYLVVLVSVGTALVRYAVVYDYIKDAASASPDTIEMVEFWGSIEVVAGGLAFVLPTFRAVVRKFSRSGREDTTAQSGAYNVSGGTDRSANSRRSFPKKGMFSISSRSRGSVDGDSEDQVRLKDIPAPINGRTASRNGGSDISLDNHSDMHRRADMMA